MTSGYFTINTNDHLYRRRLVKGDLAGGIVVAAEPIIEWSMGKSIKDLQEYCRLREWKLEVHETL